MAEPSIPQMMLEGLPDDLWHAVMTHASDKALARLALTNGLWAMRIQPALQHSSQYPAAHDLILNAEASKLVEAILCVERRYDVTLDLDSLPRSLLCGGSWLTRPVAGNSRYAKLASLVQRSPDRKALAGTLCSSRRDRAHLVRALVLRLSPDEAVELCQRWDTCNFFDLNEGLPTQLRRAEWTPPQLARLFCFLRDDPPGLDIAMVAASAVSCLDGTVFPTATQDAVVRCLPIIPLHRAAALFYIYCCEEEDADYWRLVSTCEAASVGTSVAEMQCGVPAVCHLLRVIVEFEEEEWDRDCQWHDNNRYHDSDAPVEGYPTAVIFLRSWSAAAKFPLAFGYEEQAQVLNCVHSLKPVPKRELTPVVLEWMLAMQPAGFLGYACRALL